jgi:hypothetical protein
MLEPVNYDLREVSGDGRIGGEDARGEEVECEREVLVMVGVIV